MLFRSDEYRCCNLLHPQYLTSDENTNQELLNFCVDMMNDLFILRLYIQKYNKYSSHIEIPINILRYSVFFVGWSYILYINITHLL